MNSIFEFHRQLNFKKVLFVIILVLLLIILIIGFINTSQKTTETKIEEENPNSIFHSIDNSINLELPKTYNLSQYKSTSDYLLELRSSQNLNIFIEKQNLIDNRSLSEIVNADKISYIEEFNNHSNISTVSELDVSGDYPAYTYSFHYLDSKLKKSFYLQIIWIELPTAYLIINVEIPLDELSTYSNIISDITSSIEYN